MCLYTIVVVGVGRLLLGFTSSCGQNKAVFVQLLTVHTTLPHQLDASFLKNNYIYLLLAVPGLLCGFSLVATGRDYSSLWCMVFSLCWLLLL